MSSSCRTLVGSNGAHTCGGGCTCTTATGPAVAGWGQTMADPVRRYGNVRTGRHPIHNGSTGRRWSCKGLVCLALSHRIFMWEHDLISLIYRWSCFLKRHVCQKKNVSSNNNSWTSNEVVANVAFVTQSQIFCQFFWGKKNACKHVNKSTRSKDSIDREKTSISGSNGSVFNQEPNKNRAITVLDC